MKNVLMIGTGGTIACRPDENGLAPELGVNDLLELVDIDTSHITAEDLFRLDSSNIQPEEWQQLAEETRDAVKGFGGVIITHGTDTMAYTASMLCFMLRNIPIPVVLTGSQHPMVYPDSDGRRNLRNAIIAAEKLPGGVYVAFGDSVIKGCRAVKVRSVSLNAFESINYPYVGTVVNGEFISLAQPPKQGEPEYDFKIDTNVALIRLIPGSNPALIDMLPACGIRGVVVEAFGLGGMHTFRRDHTESVINLMNNGIPVVLTSQCLYEYSAPDVYEVSHSLSSGGIISAHDMTTEAAVTKLMWALGHTGDINEIRRIMNTDLCGEIAIG